MESGERRCRSPLSCIRNPRYPESPMMVIAPPSARPRRSGVLVRIRRRRTVRRRRPRRELRRRLAALLVFVIVALGTGFAFAADNARRSLPLTRVESARLALRMARAEVTLAGRSELVYASVRAETLERMVAQARTASFPLGAPREVRALAGEVEILSRLALVRHRTAHRRAVAEATRLQRDLHARLTGFGDDLSSFPADRRLRRHYTMARLELEKARVALAGGEPAVAQRALESTGLHLTSLASHVDRRQARFGDPVWRRRWQAWVDQTLAESRRSGTAAIIVDKESGRTHLVRSGRIAASYSSELGRNGLADKLHSGDAATPEGRYKVTEKRDRGATRYHRALMLNYPNDDDRRDYQEARRRGQIPRNAGIGSLIEIHGDGGRGKNWTDGCVALANRDMDRLFMAVHVGTPVTIVGRAKIPT